MAYNQIKDPRVDELIKQIAELKAQVNRQKRSAELGLTLYAYGAQYNTVQDNITDANSHDVNTVVVTVPAGGVLVASAVFDINVLTWTSAASLYQRLGVNQAPDTAPCGSVQSIFPQMNHTGRIGYAIPHWQGGYDTETDVTIYQSTQATSTAITYLVYTTWTRIIWQVFV